MLDDLFAAAKLAPALKPLTVFRSELIGCEEAGWEDLFADYRSLKAITFSSSVEMLLRLAERLDDMEIVFGSEHILSKEHLALAQASQIIETYNFRDAWIDQKALLEALSRLLRRSGRPLLDRIVDGSLRFRLLRGRPSHEKLYLLSGPGESRVITGSANLGQAAFEGRQREIIVLFDGKPAWDIFDGYFQRDWKDSVPVEPDALVVIKPGEALVSRDEPLQLKEVPIVRVLSADISVIEQPPQAVAPGYATDVLRRAAALGAELRNFNFPKDKDGNTVINTTSVMGVVRRYTSRVMTDLEEVDIHRAEIDFTGGVIRLDGNRWLTVDEKLSQEAIRKDAKTLVDYLDSFRIFYGDTQGAVEAYWAFLVWLYSAPAAPYLRQAAVPAGIDPWVYPVYAVVYGRSSAGKTLFTKIAARSMFGFEKELRNSEFTTNKALGLRKTQGVIPLLLDDVTRDRFTKYVPELVRTDTNMDACYAPIIITTNNNVSTINSDQTKRMVTCYIDASISEIRSVNQKVSQISRIAQRELGTSLFRGYMQRLIPEVVTMRDLIDSQPTIFPDLLMHSSIILRDILGNALGDLPAWARKLNYGDYFEIRHKRFRDQLTTMLADVDATQQVVVNHRTNVMTINFAGDTNQAAQFARSVPDFIMKGRLGDRIMLDIAALGEEMSFDFGSTKPWWQRLMGKLSR